MTLTNTSITQTLLNFASLFIEQYENKHNQLPVVEKDEAWPSLCEQGDASDNEVFWKPVPMTDKLTFENVESALNITLNEEFKAYYTCIYSESIDAVAEDGQLSLLFSWNKDDFERLQQNLIGHIMMKQRLKQDLTLFFAVTDEEDMIISVDNSTGEVWVEQVGCKPHKKLANNISEFIEGLTFSF